MDSILSEEYKREVISEFLHDVMLKADVRGRDIAIIADVNPSTVSNWLNQKITAGLEKVLLIAQHYRMEDHPALRILGINREDVQLGPALTARMEHIEQFLASIDDPRKREFIASFLDNRFAKTYSEAVDMLEQMQGLFDSSSNPPT